MENEQQKAEEKKPETVIFVAVKLPDNGIKVMIPSGTSMMEASFAYRLLDIELNGQLINQKIAAAKKAQENKPIIITKPASGKIIDFIRGKN